MCEGYSSHFICMCMCVCLSDLGEAAEHKLCLRCTANPDRSRSVSGYESTSCVNGCSPKWIDLDWTRNEMWIRIWIRIRIQIQISCVYTTLSELNQDTDLDQVVSSKHGYRCNIEDTLECLYCFVATFWVQYIWYRVSESIDHYLPGSTMSCIARWASR